MRVMTALWCFVVVGLAGCVTDSDVDGAGLDEAGGAASVEPVVPDGRVLVADSVTAVGAPDNSQTFVVEHDVGAIVLRLDSSTLVLAGEFRLGLRGPNGAEQMAYEGTGVITPAAVVMTGSLNSRAMLAAAPGQWTVVVQQDGAASIDYQVTWEQL